MNLYALKEDYTIQSIIASNNVQWNRKYYETGDFSIQIPVDDYSPDMKYIYMEGRSELGILQKPLFTGAVTGDYIQLIGFFAECELNDKIVYPTFYANGNIESELYRMMTMYKDDIPNLEVNEELNDLGVNIEFQEAYGNLGTIGYEKLQTQELSQRVRYDFETGTKVYEIWQGKDRTQAQNENNFVVFSSEFGNLNNPIVEQDESNYKNWALVGGSGEEPDRIFVEVDLSDGGYKRKVFIDAKSVSYDSSKQTLEEYKNNLSQYGLEKLLEYEVIRNVTFEAASSGYVYLEDYDLGDRCDVIIEKMQLSLEARIIEIREVFKNNTHSIELVFGNKRLSDYQKARLY